VVQDLILRPQNSCFLKAVYYSPSQAKTDHASLPPGDTGQ
jgi:hypothetical protein